MVRYTTPLIVTVDGALGSDRDCVTCGPYGCKTIACALAVLNSTATDGNDKVINLMPGGRRAFRFFSFFFFFSLWATVKPTHRAPLPSTLHVK